MRRFAIEERFDHLTRLLSDADRKIHYAVLAFGLVVIVAVSAAWFLVTDFSDVSYWRALGYPGIFLLNFIGSVAIVVPVPGLIAVCSAGGLDFNLIAVGLIAGVAETIGEISGYAIGYGGRTVIEERPFYGRLASWMQRRGGIVLFIVSVIPNPVFDVIGIIAGGLRFPLLRFLGIVWAGKTIKGLIVVHTCSWIAQWLPLVG